MVVAIDAIFPALETALLLGPHLFWLGGIVDMVSLPSPRLLIPSKGESLKEPCLLQPIRIAL